MLVAFILKMFGHLFGHSPKTLEGRVNAIEEKQASLLLEKFAVGSDAADAIAQRNSMIAVLFAENAKLEALRAKLG